MVLKIKIMVLKIKIVVKESVATAVMKFSRKKKKSIEVYYTKQFLKGYVQFSFVFHRQILIVC